VDTAAHLRRAIDAVVHLPQAPVAVTITGDLTDTGRPEEYAHLRDLLSPIECPVYLLPGNHDERRGLREAFCDHPWMRDEDRGDFIQYAVDLGGLRLVAIDTVVSGASHGALCELRLRRVAEQLDEAPDTPTIVAMHHPPFRTLIDHMDEIGLLEGAPALATIVARHAQVQRVICGHVHRSIQVQWAHTTALTAPSTAHQVHLDLDARAAPAFVMEPPGFLVHAWTEDGTVITHLAPIGQFDRFAFE
jgi:3',5'-cyclic AMP phosphodiesterase CpdA